MLFITLRQGLLALLLLLSFFAAPLAQAVVTTPTADFTDNGDGTVTHKTTGLTWKRCIEGNRVNRWDASMPEYCSGFDTYYTWAQASALAPAAFAGRADWRLPTHTELLSIVDMSGIPTINQKIFPLTSDGTFWTAEGGYVSFYTGLHYSSGVPAGPKVRLVRGGQSLGSLVTASTPLPPPPVDQTAYAAPNGKMPSAAVQVNAAGTYGKATLSVKLNVSQALQTSFAGVPLGARSGFFAATYNVYVLAYLPGAGSANPVIYVKPKAPGNWGPLQWPLASFMENAAQYAVDNQVIVDILSNVDITTVQGAEIYIGYGTSDQEMLAAGRYRGVFKVQP